MPDLRPEIFHVMPEMTSLFIKSKLHCSQLADIANITLPSTTELIETKHISVFKLIKYQ